MTTSKKSPKKRSDKYDEKLQVEGTFMDIIGAVVEDAEKKTVKKRAAKKS